MATIDRDAMLAEIKSILPEQNNVSDERILSIIESIILTLPEDDDIYYGEVACKTLKAIGLLNVSSSSLSNSIKRQKSGDREIERFNSVTTNPWNYFIKSLDKLCPILWGYSLPLASGIIITTIPLQTANGCSCSDTPSDLTFTDYPL